MFIDQLSFGGVGLGIEKFYRINQNNTIYVILP